ncbi:MAG: hypothetical protein ACTJLL_01900 [Anaplasma sp.]
MNATVSGFEGTVQELRPKGLTVEDDVRAANGQRQDDQLAARQRERQLEASVEKVVRGLTGTLEETEDLPDQPQMVQEDDALEQEAKQLLEAACKIKAVREAERKLKAEQLAAEREIAQRLAALVGTAFREAMERIDQALKTANQEVQNVQDLNATRDVLGIIATFQRSVTSAAAEALKVVEAQVKNMEREIAQRKSDWALKAEQLAAKRLEAEQKAEDAIEKAVRAVYGLSGALEEAKDLPDQLRMVQEDDETPDNTLETVVITQAQQGATKLLSM